MLLAFVLFLPALLAYSNSLRADFTLDNESIILGNPALREATLSNVDLILQHSYWWPKMESALYRPITTMSYLFNFAILGNHDNPLGYHLINLLLHCINVLLVYLLARRLVQGIWLPKLIAMAWAVHPVLTESVTNIVGRADLLAGAAVLGGLLLFLECTESTGWVRVGYLFCLLGITTLGVFSKENAVALLGVVILYELTLRKEKRNLKAAALGCVAVIVPILFLLYQRAQLIPAYPPQALGFLENPLSGATFLRGKLTAIAVLARYVWKLAWPATLSADYSYNQIPLVSGSIYDWIAWAAVGAILVAAIILFRRNRTAFFFVTFAFILFLPTSNLLFNIGTIMAERFLYLPAIAFTVCIALLLRELSDRTGMRMLAPIGMALLICAWGIRTHVRNRDWRDNLSLAQASVEASPNSFKTHMEMAVWLLNNRPIGQNIDEAIRESEEAIAEIKDVPDEKSDFGPYANAASDYVMKGDFIIETLPIGADKTNAPEATRNYQRALELLLHAVRIDKISRDMQRAMEIQHGMPESDIVPVASTSIYFQLAHIYLKLGDFDKAYKAALYTRALSPKLPQASLLVSQAAMSAGLRNESAVALVAGLLITEDRSLLPPLDSLYRNGLDPTGCAFINAANGPVLNNACGPVHSEICEAYADIIQIMGWDIQSEITYKTKSIAMGQYGCTEQVLSQGKKIQVFP
jgi:tetratricopeptide (TPR) repeat protein